MDDGVNPVGCTLIAPSFNRPEAASRMGVGANPVGCTLIAPVLSIQPEAAHRMVARATIQSGALLGHPFYPSSRRLHIGWALVTSRVRALRCYLNT